jgi:hypothetical protein
MPLKISLIIKNSPFSIKQKRGLLRQPSFFVFPSYKKRFSCKIITIHSNPRAIILVNITEACYKTGKNQTVYVPKILTFMKTLKKITPLLFLFSLVFIWTSCQKDDGLKDGNTALKFTGVYNSGMQTKSSALSGVAIETFTINIGEIEFEFDDDNNNNGLTYSEIKLKGPFELDLVKDGQGQVVTLINTLNLPETGYDEIEFEFDKNENPTSQMFKKTVLIKGTINGTPFVFFTDEEFEMEIEFEDPVDLSEVENAIITVSFDVQALFDPARGGIDISNARDRNGNGIIEIFEDDPDGNEDLAEKIEDRLDDIIEAFEDMWDD